jgi:hypothetical protein
VSVAAEARASCFTRAGMPREVVEIALAMRPAMPVLRLITGYLSSLVPGMVSAPMGILEAIQSGNCTAEQFTSNILRSYARDFAIAGRIWGIVGIIATAVGIVATVVSGGAGAPALLLSVIAAGGAIMLALSAMLEDAADGTVSARTQATNLVSIILNTIPFLPAGEAKAGLETLAWLFSMVPDFKARIFDAGKVEGLAWTAPNTNDKREAMKAAAKRRAHAKKAAAESAAAATRVTRQVAPQALPSSGGGSFLLIAAGIAAASVSTR